LPPQKFGPSSATAHSRKKAKEERGNDDLAETTRERDSTTSVEDTSTLKNFSKTVPPER
jgi:hypothetical protein